jgi:hypothetical protein
MSSTDEHDNSPTYIFEELPTIMKTYKELKAYAEANFPDAFRRLPSLETWSAHGIDIDSVDIRGTRSGKPSCMILASLLNPDGRSDLYAMTW